MRTLILLADTGEHLTFSTAEVTAPELNDAEIVLSNLEMRGWIVLMDGDYAGKEPVTLTMLRKLHKPAQSFEKASAAFRAIRKGRV